MPAVYQALYNAHLLPTLASNLRGKYYYLYLTDEEKKSQTGFKI